MALQSIVGSAVPATIEWDVLVVDNNSSDDTRRVTEGFCRRHPGRVRYLFEAEQGKSYALNTGIREARGNVLAFTDDDVVVDGSWLRNLTTNLENGEWVGAGGRIIPVWSRPLPRWLVPGQRLLSGPFVALDLGPQPRLMREPPFGANMAFRREMFEKYGEFRTDLGRIGDSLRSGEDTEFARRLLSGGERIRYEPAAVVHHPVPANRLRKKYLRSWFFEYSRSDLAQSGDLPESTSSFAGVPLFLVRRMIRWSVQWLFSLRPSTRFACSLNLWTVAGTIVGFYELSRNRLREVGQLSGGHQGKETIRAIDPALLATIRAPGQILSLVPEPKVAGGHADSTPGPNRERRGRRNDCEEGPVID